MRNLKLIAISIAVVALSSTLLALPSSAANNGGKTERANGQPGSVTCYIVGTVAFSSGLTPTVQAPVTDTIAFQLGYNGETCDGGGGYGSLSAVSRPRMANPVPVAPRPGQSRLHGQLVETPTERSDFACSNPNRPRFRD